MRALLGLLVFGQGHQQDFGGNTLSVSCFPVIEIDGGFEPLPPGLFRRGPKNTSSPHCPIAEVHRDYETNAGMDEIPDRL